ncbi:MAG TPA: hypothetical protein VLT86_18790 [Vicinamibacterales bacterium]|nr:hypothetical protein [Vicinamibacterales bacterium]
MFQIRRPATSLEGVLTLAALVLVGGLYAWARVGPMVYWIAPNFRAVKHGPSGFPVTIEIRDAGLGVRNDSDERWGPCEIVIGSGSRFYRVYFAVEPHGRMALAYSTFRNKTMMPARGEGYALARELITVECVDALGRTHLTHF